MGFSSFLQSLTCFCLDKKYLLYYHLSPSSGLRGQAKIYGFLTKTEPGNNDSASRLNMSFSVGLSHNLA